MCNLTIVDAHTHAYSEEVISDPKAWAENLGEKHWLKLVAPENKRSLQDWASMDDMLSRMDTAGVDKAVLLGWYWENHKTCLEQNSWYKKYINLHPDRFIAFAAVQPLEGQKAIDSLKDAMDHGFKGIGEMHPAVQGFSMRDSTWLQIVEFCIAHNLVINMHVSEAVGREHAGRTPTPFHEFQWLAETYPEAKIILAHWGGLLPFYELNPTVKKAFKNVCYDTAASPLIYNSEIHASVINTIGHDKILFGTDFPLNLYPSKQSRADFVTYLNEVRNSGITKDSLDAILGMNARKLLRSSF